jgi:lysophospholipase L1-like esterase
MARLLGLLVAATVAAAVAVLPAEAREMTAVDYGSGLLGDYSKNIPGTVKCSKVVGAKCVATTSVAGADVLLVGDSITSRCYPELQKLVAAKGKVLAVRWWSGSPAAEGVRWLLAQPRFAGVVVMELGSNDVFGPGAVAGQIQQAKAAYPGLLWQDVQVARTKTAAVQLADQRNSMWVNAQIRGQLPDRQVIPWATSLASKPTRLTAYLIDGVHPSVPTGCAYLAAVQMAKIGPLL